jgi:hypothetical protein
MPEFVDDSLGVGERAAEPERLAGRCLVETVAVDNVKNASGLQATA